jgi:integrase
VASIHRHPNSKYWYCTIGIPGHGQLQRTTKQTDRHKALEFAQRLEAAARANTLTESQARKVLSEIYEIKNDGEKLPGSSVRHFLEAWVANKKRETAASTGRAYSDATQRFLDSLGDKANRDISALSRRDILKFRDDLAARLGPSSVNHAVKIVRMALKDAQSDGLLMLNPAFGVRPIKAEATARRRPFTLSEIRRVLRTAGGEWRGIILFGLYTGQRLGDIANLTWQNVDLERSELALVTRKTKRRVLVPLAAPLQNFLADTATGGDDPRQPIFPEAASVTRTGTLSNQFYQILADAGLVEPRSHAANGKGRENRRAFNEISFHALRHTATSLLKDAGISPVIVQDIIGHDSPAVSAHYTHISQVAKRQAIDAMPDVTSEPTRARRK